MMRKIARVVATVLYVCLARHLPGSFSRLGLGLTNPFRATLCRFMIKKCGKNIIVEQGAWFGHDLEIGDYSGLGLNARLDGPGIVIGNYVLMAPDVVILTGNHMHSDITRPMMAQGIETAPVIIEDDVWIGTRALLLPGIRIGRSSIIGAGAVVAKDIPPFSVVVGNPAKVVRKRDVSPSPGKFEA
jgi:maltose O-acetyltransferase